jgi:hypothetical protein
LRAQVVCAPKSIAPQFDDAAIGTSAPKRRYCSSSDEARQEEVMGRGVLLWLLGIPLPIILLIWVFGGLHG